MRDTSDLVRLIKQAALEAVESKVPTIITYGTVISVSPLKVKIDNKLILEAVHLEVVKSLSDYKTEITLPEITIPVYQSTPIKYGGKVECTVHNALKLDDKVALLRFQGGKRYLVIDRV